MIKTILVDDDIKHLGALQKILSADFKQVEILAACTNVPDAVAQINLLKPHLVFLDIEMGSYTGFDLLEMVDERNFEVIFTTSYQRYAIQAIKASALDYIEKPIIKENLAEAIQRFSNKTSQANIKNLLENFRLPNENQRIALPDGEGMHFFEANRIICCTTDNSYTYFFIKPDTTKAPVRRLAISRGLSYWEDFLFDKGFFYRVHNQYMVNINYIKLFVRKESAYLIMEHYGETVPVARTRKDDLIRFLKTKGMVL
jgi:two-component system, LytTR family, response regulator